MAKKILCAVVIILALSCVLASCSHAHEFSEWETTKVATCTAEGTKERYCSCGETQTSTIAALGHNYVDGVCDACGVANNNEGSHTHEFSAWETTKAATCTAGGTKERYCSCGEAQSATIAALGHNYIDDVCDTCGANKGEGGVQVSSDEEKYEEACALIEDGDYEEAYKILNSIKTYEPAKEKLGNFFYAPTAVAEGRLTYGSNLGPQMMYENKTYTYDGKGNITSITIVEYNKTYNFLYDSKGNELTGYPLEAPNSYEGARTCTYKDGRLSKVAYANSCDEYFYNEDGTINKIVHTSQYDDNTQSSYETAYIYTYYSDSSVKTMRYRDGYNWLLYHYDTNGMITKVDVYDDEFSECVGCYSVSYGEYGLEKIERVAYSSSGTISSRAEVAYTYDNEGKLTDTVITQDGETRQVYLLSDHVLCYSENDNAKNRVGIVTVADVSIIASMRV